VCYGRVATGRRQAEFLRGGTNRPTRRTKALFLQRTAEQRTAELRELPVICEG